MFFIIIIIMFVKGQLRSLFLNPQSGAGPSISSSVVPCSFVLLVYIVMLILVFYLCPSSVRVAATFSGIVLLPYVNVFLSLCFYYKTYPGFTFRGKSLVCLKSDTYSTNILLNIQYTGCDRRKGPNFGRVFLMLNYTDITQNTYIQS